MTGAVVLERTPGSSLVYAVGSLTNRSGHRRFDVNVHVALADAAGRPAGLARDHRSSLEPGEVWSYRALVLDSRARSATVEKVEEEP